MRNWTQLKLFIKTDIYAAVNFNMTYHKGMNFYTQKFIYVSSINFVQDVLKRKEKKDNN